MKHLKYIVIVLLTFSLTFSCSNTPKESAQKTTTDQPAEQTKEETNKVTVPVAQLPDTEPSESKGTEAEKKEVIEQPDQKVTTATPEKKEVEPIPTKNKDEENRKAQEQADQLAQEQAAQKAKEEADRFAREQAEKLAKEDATKKEKEAAKKLAKEQAALKAEADRLAKEQAEKKAATQVTENADAIIKKVDNNLRSDTRIITSEMIIHGKRNSRTIRSKGYAKGDEKSFTEYLSPAKEKGTKMLKLDDRLWIYSPSTDRSIQLSGHMLKQSVMGSDLSYEDMMEDRELTDVYDAKVVGEENYDGRKCWVLELNAIVNDASYEKRKMWVDQQRYVPLKEELFAKSGQLLKKTTMTDVVKIEGRWFPKKMNFKDMLKSGKGTDFVIIDIQFNPKIPAHIFSKASLKK